jgi:hypothetical protein
MLRLVPALFAAVAPLAGGACSTTLPPAAPSAAALNEGIETTGSPQSSDGGMSCRQLTGRAQLILLRLRNRGNAPGPTTLGGEMQKAFSALFGSDGGATDQASRNQADRARLDDYNAQLKTRGCAQFDIDAELRNPDPRSTPTPIAAAQSG